jgi:pyruvate dehydrogenase E1 component alpha subunit
MNKETLISFNEDIAKIYESGKIKAPIHLSGTNEDEIITILKDYRDGDWIFSTWRSHYHWLCSGRSPEELKEQIISGHSMHIFGDRFFTSAIVAGISPIALGVAWGLKLRYSPNMVYCFIGDGAYNCGITQECIRYASGHDLPICFILEDNGLTVKADTNKIWGEGRRKKLIRYKYERKYNHAGTGNYVMF